MHTKVGYLLFILSLIFIIFGCDLLEEKDSGGDSGTTTQPQVNPNPTPAPTPTPAAGRYGIIFTTTASVNGGQGLANLDILCTTEASNQLVSGTFKALVAGSSRRPCTTANCSGGPSENSGWVLLGKTEYRKKGGIEVIGTTNASGIFSFPLTSEFGDAVNVWTGLNDDWTSSDGSLTNCNGWQVSTNLGMGNIGDAGATDNTSLKSGSETCNQTNQILCAEQVDPPAQESYRIIFATATTYQGGHGYVGVDGINFIDNICSSEAIAKGFIFSTYKAMVTSNDGGIGTVADNPRRACYSADCSDQGSNENLNWVLTPNTEYRREDGTTVIGTTTANGIFSFPLDNSFTGANETYWTGFPSTWAILNTGGTNKDCLTWTSKLSSARGRVGVGDATDSNAVDRSSGDSACNQYHKILCVEQTR